MKKLVILMIVATVLMLIPTAQAQRPAPSPKVQHADVADQKACYQQAQVVVEEVRKSDEEYAKKNNSTLEEDVNGINRHWGISGFDGAYYDAASKTCYVEYSKTSQMSYGTLEKPGNMTIHLMYTLTVEDAFEGKVIADFFGEDVQKGAGKNPYVEQSPSICRVNGEKCDSRAVFNGLLWKLIPAFRPVTAFESKR